MFYCEACAKKNGYPFEFYLPQSRGPCELCKKTATCVDVPSSRLPNRATPPPEIPQFVCPQCGATHDRGYYPPGAFGTYRCLQCGYVGPTKEEPLTDEECDTCRSVLTQDSIDGGRCTSCGSMVLPKKAVPDDDAERRNHLIKAVVKRFDSSDFDEHIHELKSKEASAINNLGPEEQVNYLIEECGEDWVREVFLPKVDAEPEYPACEKMLGVKDKSQEIGRFLDWLREEKGWMICNEHTHDDSCYERVPRYEGDEEGDVQLICGMCNGQLFPVSFNPEFLLAEYFEIDLDTVEVERQEILERHRKGEG